jgi:hypothetical protein
MANFFPIDGYEGWPAPDIDTVSVAATSTQMAAANNKRVELVLTNNGSTTVWVNVGGAAEVGKGLSILPDGGVLTIAIDRDSHGWRQKIVNGIVASGTANVATFEQSVP